MPIPSPEPGLVISYCYVWDDDEIRVTVLPVTHRAPRDPLSAVEIPDAIKKHLGLDHEPPWIVVSEGDQFVWPGYDLRKLRGSERFFESVLTAFRSWHRASKVWLTSRE